MYEDIDFSKFNDKNFLSSNTNKNVKKLYKIVESYYKRNYLKENEEDEYYFMVNGEVFKIEYNYVYEEFYSIKKCLEKTESIELDDILNNRITMKQMRIKEKLDTMNDYIEELKEDGLSLKLIKRSLNIK